MYLLGYDCGTSSIKATLLDGASGKVLASATEPKKEMPILAEKPGYAEQDPETWWRNLKAATAAIKEQSQLDLADVSAIGIAYQMHGLVLLDKAGKVLRPCIIWCDSRAVGVGEQAAGQIGEETCLEHTLNLPGNFTLTRLAWVKENEPDIYAKTHKAMLPGDYLAYRMTGQLNTTASGLSEWIGWDFKSSRPAGMLFDHFGIDQALLPDLTETFSVQGKLTAAAAAELGLSPKTPIAYRAGDQPNNAFSLNVLEPGEIAATAGTSGVVYGIGDEPNYDQASRVNTFVHVNSCVGTPRYGTLMCINGTGSLNSWLKHHTMGRGEDYPQMNELAAQAPVGSAGLVMLPYGNGAERTLANKDLGASVHHLHFNVHERSHVLRAAQEAIVFAFHHGLGIMQEMGIAIKTVRAGDANMFLSPLFGQAFATVSGAQVELYNTDGSQGAARGAGLGAGVFASAKEAFVGLQKTRTIEPRPDDAVAYQDAYGHWAKTLAQQLGLA